MTVIESVSRCPLCREEAPFVTAPLHHNVRHYSCHNCGAISYIMTTKWRMKEQSEIDGICKRLPRGRTQLAGVMNHVCLKQWETPFPMLLPSWLTNGFASGPSGYTTAWTGHC